MIEIKQLTIKETASQLEHLFNTHWQEVYGMSGRTAKIDLPFYYKMEDAGFAFALWAFFDEEIVGYSVCFLAPNLHCAGHISCNNDALFVHPDFRDSPLGLRLIRQTEKTAKEYGADLMVWNAPLNTNLIHILPRMKYQAMEQVLIKEI